MTIDKKFSVRACLKQTLDRLLGKVTAKDLSSRICRGYRTGLLCNLKNQVLETGLRNKYKRLFLSVTYVII